ncbi:thermonuclease family protein [Parvibaculum sp.]|uniref:thermonuclease family protein n=1 Tax=Parvibaculum sp. TaxID=2024848 RepID=UPI003210A774
MSFARLCAFLAAIAGLVGLVVGEGAACNLKPGDRLTVREVLDGQSLVLADGREAVLAGINVPKPGEGRGQYADEARALVADLLRGGAHIAYGKAREDRYGRPTIFPLLADGRTLQARLVADGLARVMSSPDNRICTDELLALEAEARAAHRGLWRDPYFAVIAATDLTRLRRAEGRFAIVEGIVADAAFLRGRLYVNFGDDRRTDFTVTVAPAAAKLFQNGVWTSIPDQPKSLVGQTMRVRGFIGSFNGPEIAATHPEQIEFPEHGREAAKGDGRERQSSH